MEIGDDHPRRGERPELLAFCGVAALVGNLAPLVAMAISVPVAKHDFLADTISDLGRGPHAWIMDTGFYFNAAGMLALAIAAAHAHLGRLRWSLAVFGLALLALVITLIGIWDTFHTAGDDPPGMTVHTKLTFALFPLYLAGPLLMLGDMGRVSPVYRWLFAGSACFWAVFAVAFKLAPNGIDGLLEKIAIASTLLWTLPLAWHMLARGRRRLHV